jgi:Rrf2 family protein
MILSKTTGYGIRALAYIAARSGRPCQLQEIAESEAIPKVFLQKILGELRRHRILRSATGIHGGYELERQPNDVTLFEVFSLLDSNPHLDTCILGRGLCHPENACGLHREWQRMRDKLVDVLKGTTIERFMSSGIDTTLDNDQTNER